MRTQTFAVATLLVAHAWSLNADTYPRQAAVDAIHYRFAVTVALDGGRIEGEAVATLRLLAPIREIALDLVSASNGDAGMKVSAVSLGGHPISYSHEANRLRLRVPEAAAPGQDLVYTIAYSGLPADGLRTLATIYGDWSVFSDNWPDRARHWLPMIDHPYDKATGELIVTAPAEYQVVSNGALVEEIDLGNGRRQTHWRQSVPIASWLFTLGVARFDVHHAGRVQNVPLQTWVFPQDRAQGRSIFEETSRRAMDFFSQRVGPYPYQKLANVQAAGITGGMENATAIFYGEKSVTSGRVPVIHEIAHQWFGNSVTERDWDDVWLSEGFATYFAHLYTEHHEGREAFVHGLAENRANVLELESKTPDTPVIHRNLADMQRVLNQLVYQKGGWILHMLRAEVGTDMFWKGTREYYRRYRDQNASSDDFRQVMEQASGKSLKPFFDQWLRRAGVPRLEGTWRYRREHKEIEVNLSQTQRGQPFSLTVEVGLADTSGRTFATSRQSFDARSTTFRVPVAAEPATVSLDPETWLLADLRPLLRR
jgi:aminopeptidase N